MSQVEGRWCAAPPRVEAAAGGGHVELRRSSGVEATLPLHRPPQKRLGRAGFLCWTPELAMMAICNDGTMVATGQQRSVTYGEVTHIAGQ